MLMAIRLTTTQARAWKIPKARAVRTRSSPPRRPDGYASQLEADYAVQLELQRQHGEIRRWVYEPFRLNLSHGLKPVRYTPDFLVFTESGRCEIHECKGLWRPKDRVVVKICADLWREWRVVGVTRSQLMWYYEDFSYPSSNP